VAKCAFHIQLAPLRDGDFEGKPNVLLLGQYSTGKTTFIKHLLGTEYPGCNIGGAVQVENSVDP
jgi:EH domain-containing protein 1